MPWDIYFTFDILLSGCSTESLEKFGGDWGKERYKYYDKYKNSKQFYNANQQLIEKFTKWNLYKKSAGWSC